MNEFPGGDIHLAGDILILYQTATLAVQNIFCVVRISSVHSTVHDRVVEQQPNTTILTVYNYMITNSTYTCS